MPHDSGEFVNLSQVFEKFGKYQIIQYVYTCLPVLIVNIININYIFIAGDINYRCQIPECETEPHNQHPTWWPNATIDRCSRPVLNSSHHICTNNSFTGVLETCNSWVYESEKTIIAELDLACQPWKINLIGTIHSLGTMTSMIIAGWITDKFGRKPALILCAVTSCVGYSKVFVSSYYLYIIIEYLEAVCSGGVNASAMVALIEITGTKRRVLCGTLLAYSIYFGEFLFAILAMNVQYWKHLAAALYIPPILFIFYIFIINESPRWLILKGKTEDAKKALKKIAEDNKINISFEELNGMDTAELRDKFKMGATFKKEGIKDIFRSKEVVKRLLVVSFCRFTSSFVYYGLVVNSVWLPGNRYTNFMLTTVMSFPGELMALYLLNKIGRKIPLMSGYIISGVLCIASAYVPKDYVWTTVILFMFSKMVIALCFTGAVSYIMELFPTSARGTLLGLGSFASRLGSMLAPLTPIMLTVSPALPSILFGATAITACMLLTLMPETKGMPLVDTIEQVNSAKRAKGTKAKNVENDVESSSLKLINTNKS